MYCGPRLRWTSNANPASDFTDDSKMPKLHIVEHVEDHSQYLRIGMNMIMVYFKVLSQHSPGGTKDEPDTAN
jgi:hypothetical protein